MKQKLKVFATSKWFDGTAPKKLDKIFSYFCLVF